MEEVKAEVTPASNPKPVRRKKVFPVAETKYGNETPKVVVREPEPVAPKVLSPRTQAELDAGRRAIEKLRRG